MSSYSLSIVVPCYNEEQNLKPLVEAFSAICTKESIELVVVNNGSTDNSENVIQELSARYSFITPVHVELNQGYGYGILSGLSKASASFLGWTHADLQTDPNDVLKAFKLIQLEQMNEDLYVKGNRKGRPFMDQFFTSGMSLFESIYLGERLWDINAQPNIFHRNFYNSWKDHAPHDFSLDLFVLYKAKKANINVKRFDVVFPERIHGESSWNTGLSAKWKFIKRTLEFSKQLKQELKND